MIGDDEWGKEEEQGIARRETPQSQSFIRHNSHWQIIATAKKNNWKSDSCWKTCARFEKEAKEWKLWQKIEKKCGQRKKWDQERVVFFFCNRTPVVKCYYIKRTICVPAWDENEETFYLLQAFVCNIWRENITLNRISKCFSFRFFKDGI